ncbi:uncharacterized protein LOC126381131 [Pectinophora gossypiella]|uniref:uncharacterized protein LOC126381131 n=1 Tax=Pectinophora gossypiella TaxID=13191 RepID=UPI00214EB237|nr:uncharacterized protein LOC126381131 [Pectinophora gossypiella]
MSSSFIGTLGCFDHKTMDWTIFYGRLKMFLELNDIDEKKHCAALLTNLSEDSYRLLCNLIHPKTIENAKFNELVDAFKTHFTPKRSTFADRDKFYEARKVDSESAEEWAARLRGLAVYCGFGSELNTLLRDRFVLGFKSGPERDRLREQDLTTLTFAKALEIAQQVACVKQVKENESVVVKQEPLYRASVAYGSGSAKGAGAGGIRRERDDAVARCTVCGLKNHVAEKCRYKNYRCNKCHNKGHLKKMCELKVNSIGVESSPASAEEEAHGSHDCEECRLFNLRFPN